MTVQDDNGRLVLPKIPGGFLVSGNRQQTQKRNEKRRKQKTVTRLEDLSNRLHGNHNHAVGKQEKEVIPRPVKLSALKEKKRKADNQTEEIKLPGLCKLPAINVCPSEKNNRTPVRRLTAADESGLDGTSLLHPKCKNTTKDNLKPQRSRESTYTSRDYLMSLMPPKTAKRYNFSEGAIHGAQQELLRLKKLMGRDNRSAERSHTGTVIYDTKRRSASNNAILSGNKGNTTNNSTPPDTEQSALDRLTAWNTLRNKIVLYEKESQDTGKVMHVILKRIFSLEKAKLENPVNSRQRIVRMSENTSRKVNCLTSSRANRKWEKSAICQIFKMEPTKKNNSTDSHKRCREENK